MARSKRGLRPPRKGRGKPDPDGWRRGPGWPILALCGLGALLVAFGAYALFVSVSDGTLVELHLTVEADDEGNLALRCGSKSTPSVCAPGEQVFRAETRDRIRVLLEADDGEAVRLGGGAYWLWPAGFQLRGSDATSFTAWRSGTFPVHCQASSPCMPAQLVVA